MGKVSYFLKVESGDFLTRKFSLSRKDVNSHSELFFNNIKKII